MFQDFIALLVILYALYKIFNFLVKKIKLLYSKIKSRFRKWLVIEHVKKV